MRRSVYWFTAFTAVFAVCAAFVFWDTWSTDFVPVMPDCATNFRDWSSSVEGFFRNWIKTGKFVPDDLKILVASPWVWVELQYVLAAYFAALGMVYFLKGKGLSNLACYGAALFLAFSGYWFTLFSAGHLGWFQWMTYGVFVFGLIDRALEKGKPRHWLLLGACLAWGSMHQSDLWFLFSAFSAVYFLFRAFTVFRGTVPAAVGTASKTLLWRWAKGSGLAFAALLVIGLTSFRSAFVNDLAGRDKQIDEGQTVGGSVKGEAEKRWVFVTNWSMPPEAVKEFVKSGVEGDTSCPYTLAIGQKNRNGIRPYTGRLGRPLGAATGNYRQHSLYIGWVTVGFALAAVVGCLLFPLLTCVHPGGEAPRKPDRATILFFAAAAVVFFLFSLGRFCEPVYRLVYALPFGDYLRAPVKWHHLTELSLAVLAGFGLDLYVAVMKGRLFGATFWRAVEGVLVATGVLMLAGNARLYCAPHRTAYDLQFVDARVLSDPRGQEQIRQAGAYVAGRFQTAALLEVPRPKDTAPVAPLPKGEPLVVGLGLLSLVGTLGVAAYGVRKS